MAVLTAQGIASTAIPLLVRNLVLARTVTIVPSDEFGGPNGETITVRVPQPGRAREQVNRGDTLVADDVYEVPVDVAMKHLYHLKNVSDQELSFDLENFARQVTRVQTSAVATSAEEQLTDVMNALAGDGETDGTAGDTRSALLEARAFLSSNDAPAGSRYLAVGPNFANLVLELLGDRETANTDSALREATLGRYLGFTVIESNGIDADSAVAYHSSGFVWANRVPRSPRGATDSAATSDQSVGLRQVFQYDASTAQDQSLLSAFAGAAAVYDWDFDESGEPESGDVAKRFYKLEIGS